MVLFSHLSPLFGILYFSFNLVLGFNFLFCYFHIFIIVIISRCLSFYKQKSPTTQHSWNTNITIFHDCYLWSLCLLDITLSTHSSTNIHVCYTLISFSLYNPFSKCSKQRHIKINVGPRAYKNICWTAMTRLKSQASPFVLNPVCPKAIRPKLCQFVVRNLDDVDRCDGVRVNSH